MGESASEDHIKRVERELAKEDSLLANMLEQAPGMLGMAFMFVITIGMGVWLQPWFNAAGLQAFGESGATQARWILLELVSIFAFTFVILWLAKKHLQHVIKYGLLFVLFLALCYTTVPGAHILLVPEIETEAFEFTGDNVIDEEIVSINSDGSMITQIVNWTDNVTTHNFVISKRSADTSLEWQHNLDAFPGTPMITVMEGEYAYTATNGKWVWSFDKENGDILSKYACFAIDGWDGTADGLQYDSNRPDCITALEVVENPTGDANSTKGALYITTGGNEIVRQNTFHGTNFTAPQAKWSYPQLQLNEGYLQIKQYDADSILLVTREGAAMILLEETSDSFPGTTPAGWVDSCKLEWYYDSSEDGMDITSFNIVDSPWEDDVQLAMIGHDTGLIKAFIVDEEIDDGYGIFEEEERWKGDDSFKGPIGAINSFDLSNDSENELWIADADGIHGLFYSSLIEYATLDVVVDEGSILSADGWKIQVISTEVIDSINGTYSMEIQSGEFDPETMYNVYGIQLSDVALLTGLIIAVILMAALIIHPEWYVVNTVGVLVGAGVIVMLGVTFVPTLIVIFMILAAIYDAWAVYRSKHMLDLADTMIGLNLPILLVAPQGSGYSMLKEKESIRPPEAVQSVGDATDAPVIMKKRKKPQDAMFMGLGDVIFPGMLVVSCVDSISTGGLAVGISALIGGLVGYLVLMGYVASGRPQAGLPLLNGGAILGYIIGGLIFVGTAAFSFGISF
jgi:presenilin-like A22 family membrane protease